jgi:para-nitrobenzyl esterase
VTRLAFACVLASCLASVSSGEDDPLLVQTASGAVRGKRVGEALVWLGIPYAKPPVGELRFRHAQDPEPWEGVREATRYPPPSAQGKNPVGIKPEHSKEDSLYLNVFRPAEPAGEAPLPVVVWVHGGSNLYHSPVADTRGCEDLFVRQRRDVILVTIQYRLGPLGWLAHPALTAEAGSSGNYGLSDIIQALAWVRKNIRAFGGDPAKVLAAGGSAGSIDLCAVFVSPRARGLFNAIWMQSWPCVANPRALREERQGVPLAEALGCTGSPEEVRARLRALSAQEIQGVMPDLVEESEESGKGHGGLGGFMPVYAPDDPFLPAHPLEIMREGKQNPGTLIIGAQIHDSWRRKHGPPPRTPEALREKLRDLLKPFTRDRDPGPIVEEILAMYPEETGDRFLVIANDLLFHAPNREIARTAAATGTPAYWYVFTYPLRHPKTGEELRVWHGSINPFWNQQIRLGKTGLHFEYSPSREDLAVAEMMLRFYTSAAATGDPTHPGSPAWPRVGPEGEATPLLIGVPARTPEGYHRKQLDYFEGLWQDTRR